MKAFLKEKAGALAFAVGVLLLWQLASVLELVSPLFFPSPARTFAALQAQVADGRLWPPLASTVRRMVDGWVVASLLGVVVGALIAGSRWARALCRPLLEFLRPLPASAIIPIGILAFGLSGTMSTFVIAFGSIWPVLLASVHGFSHVDERLQEVSRLMGMGRLERLRKVDLPSALPDILAGARVGLAVALILAVVTEMQASLPGLGQSILMAQRSFRSAELYAGVVMLGLVGFVASAALLRLERHALRWRAQPQ